MPMRSFRLPDDLDARLEESRGEQKRSEWLLEAVREKLALSGGSVIDLTRPDGSVLTVKGDPAHRGPIDRADAFRAAAARRQAALRQKP